jgi:hypothetical protein
LLFLQEQPFRQDDLRILFGDKREMGPQKTTCKNNILLNRHLRMPLETCPQQMLLSNKSKGIVLPFAGNAIGQEILANFVVKKAKRQILDEKILV